MTVASAGQRAASRRAPAAVEVVVSVPTVVKALGIFFGVLLVYLVQGRAAVDRAVGGLHPRPRPARERARAARLGTGQGGAARVRRASRSSLFVIVVWAVEARSGSRSRRSSTTSPPTSTRRSTAACSRTSTRAPTRSRSSQSVAADAAKEPARGGGQPARRGRRARRQRLLARDADVPDAVRADRQAAAHARRRSSSCGRSTRRASSASTARSATPSRYTLIGNVVISVIAGTVVGVAAVIVGAPSPMVLALIVGLFDLIPQIGSTIAAFIVTRSR